MVLHHYNVSPEEYKGLAPEQVEVLVAGLEWIGVIKRTEKQSNLPKDWELIKRTMG